MSSSDSLEAALSTLKKSAKQASLDWLTTLLAQSAFDTTTFFNAYAGCGRRFGDLAPSARSALLIHACALLPSDQHVTLVRDIFRKGDNQERVALLRALNALPDPKRFLETAIEACRTHVQDVFEAIACDNPFPAQHFPDLNFHQLVMKALFTQAPVARIVGLGPRVTDELRRMATDYAAERNAAGRVVPEDVALILHTPGAAP